jgi:hypothetical protein
MPSPFPGMNPYLESCWPGVHHWFITELARCLNANLSPNYYAAVEVRIYETTDSGAAESALIGIPDTVLVPRPVNAHPHRSAVATLIEPVMVTVPMPEVCQEGYLEIREAGTHQVITVLEILSPKNKQPGQGRGKYEEKRQQILASQTHLVEIDLIRKFKPMAFVGPPIKQHYRILVSRAKQRPKAALYGFNLQDAIPIFPLPLRAGEPELPIDLKPLLDHLYDAGAFSLQVDYSQDPPAPKLAAEDAEWCDRILQQNQLRP